MARLSDTLLGTLLVDLTNEIKRACAKHPSYPSIHHGVAVIEEELTELKTEVFKQNYDHEKGRKEALQIACTAIRYIHDIDRQYGRKELEKPVSSAQTTGTYKLVLGAAAAEKVVNPPKLEAPGEITWYGVDWASFFVNPPVNTECGCSQCRAQFNAGVQFERKAAEPKRHEDHLRAFDRGVAAERERQEKRRGIELDNAYTRGIAEGVLKEQRRVAALPKPNAEPAKVVVNYLGGLQSTQLLRAGDTLVLDF